MRQKKYKSIKTGSEVFSESEICPSTAIQRMPGCCSVEDLSAAIDRAEARIANGRFLSEDEAIQRIRKW